MNGSPFDDWPNSKTFGASAAHLHAFGAVNLLYNRLEDAMSTLFRDVLGGDQQIAEAMYSRLTNRHRIDVFRLLASNQSLSDDLRERLSHALLCFDICAENRNTLMHIIHDHHTEPRDWLMGKKKSSDKSRDLFYSLPVTEVRQVADEIKAVRDFAAAISLFLFRAWLEPQGEKVGHEELWRAIKAAGPNTLPEKPPRPDKLTPLQLEEGR